MSDLTSRQLEVLAAITDHWARHGLGPTVRELMAALGIRSPNGVACQLKALAAHGAIEWDRGAFAARGVWPAGTRAKVRAVFGGT